MAISAIDKELIRYFIRLNEPQKKSLLEVMKLFVAVEDKQTAPITIKQYNKELDDAMTRMDKGEFTTMEQLEKEMETW